MSNRYRDKTPAEVVNEGEAWEEIERERAEERMSKGGGVRKSSQPDEEKGRATDKVGEKVGVSGRTYEKGKTVKEKATDPDEDEEIRETAKEQWEKMERGEYRDFSYRVSDWFWPIFYLGVGLGFGLPLCSHRIFLGLGFGLSV